MKVYSKNINKLTFGVLTAFSLLGYLAFSPNSGADLYATVNHIQVTICHATGSSTNPYQQLTVDDDAVDGNGNGNSDHNQIGHQNGEDIIPPGTWDSDGRNWDPQGQAIWNNDCNIPTNTPTSTPTSTPTATPTNSPTPTPTDTPSPTPTDNEEENNDPSVTPTPTGTTQADPNDVCTNLDGVQTSIPSGWYQNGAGSTECRQFQYGGAPQGGTNDGQVLGVSTEGQVLGASTLAATGQTSNYLFMLGLILLGTSFYGLSSEKAKEKV